MYVERVAVNACFTTDALDSAMGVHMLGKTGATSWRQKVCLLFLHMMAQKLIFFIVPVTLLLFIW